MRFPDEATLLFFRLLASEVLKIRKMAMSVCSSWLKITKPKASKLPWKVEGVLPNNGPGARWPIAYGYREDNRFILEHEKQAMNTQAEWDSSHFVFKVHYGFYIWPQEFRTYAPPSAQSTSNRPVEAMESVERSVLAIFDESQFMERMIYYFSLEEKKGHDEFNAITYSLFYVSGVKLMLFKKPKNLKFQRLFRNYSIHILPYFTPHLEKLLEDRREGAQRLACEIIAGMIDGAKLWRWEHHSQMVEWLRPRLLSCVEAMTTEAEKNWGTCIATIYGTCESRQLAWLTEALFQLVERPTENSFHTTTRFYLLHCALNQFEWRCPGLWRRLYEHCVPFVGSPHQNLRYRVGGCMASATTGDIQGMPGSDGLAQAKAALGVVTVEEIVRMMDSSVSRGWCGSF